jgi:hypothetical protein
MGIGVIHLTFLLREAVLLLRASPIGMVQGVQREHCKPCGDCYLLPGSYCRHSLSIYWMSYQDRVKFA